MEPLANQAPLTFGDIGQPESPFPPDTPPPPDVASILPMVLQRAQPQTPAYTIFSADQEDELARELDQVLEGYDEAMRDRWKKERLIEDCYNLIPQKDWQGSYEDPTELQAGEIMSSVDQGTARVTKNLLSVEPFILCHGIESIVPQDISVELAPKVSAFLETYLKREIGIEDLMSQIVYPTFKFGNAVQRVWWTDEGKVEWTILNNQDVVMWPPWEPDWQKAEWAGHRLLLTVSQFRRQFGMLGTPLDVIEEIVSGEDSEPDGAQQTFADLKGAGIEPTSVTSVKRYGLISVYELWGHLILPGDNAASRVRLFYHREKRRILWSRLNDHRTGKHPYHPVRYKIPSMSAWGQGQGHELLMVEAKSTMYDNLEHDVLKSSCFGVNLVAEGTTADEMFDQPSPGMKIPTNDPTGDFKHVSLADAAPLEMLQYARSNNERSKIALSGQSAVLSGQGDPTLKSGGGTGSTMALIQEAGKKFGFVEDQIRRDLVRIFVHVLELCAQYGEGMPFVEYAPPEDAEMLSQLLTTLPDGADLGKILRLAFAAPSASENNEVRKNEIMVLYNMLQQHATAMLQQFAMPVYQQTNPAGMIDYMMQWANVMSVMGEKVVEMQNVPGFKGKLPRIQLQATPAEMMANQLLMQNQQLQQALMASSSANQAGADPGKSTHPEGPEGEGS